MNFCEGTNQIGRTDNFSNTKKKINFPEKESFRGKLQHTKEGKNRNPFTSLFFYCQFYIIFHAKSQQTLLHCVIFFINVFGTTSSWIFISFIKVFNLFFLGKNLNLLLLFTGNLTNVQLYGKSQYNCIV